MKRLLGVSGLVALLVLTVSIPSTADAPPVSVTVRPPVPSRPLELAVGESITFEIHIEADEPFIVAMAMTDSYYPGRGVFWHGSDRATHATSATLYLTMTGKDSTADLPAVCDWPEPGLCWPEGAAPVTIAVGVRFKGGLATGEQFPFSVEVP